MKHIKEPRKDTPDLDSNRGKQADRALKAFEDGYNWAKRHAQDGSCEECSDLDGEVVPIEDVINEKSDHKYGRCTFIFFKEKPKERN